MQKIEIAEPIDTTGLISDVFLVEIPIFVSDTQAREEIIATTEIREDANAPRE